MVFNSTSLPSRRVGPTLRWLTALSIAITISAFISGGALAQARAPIVYPSNGQNMQQQSKDEGECRTWAQQQTGFNPSTGIQYSPGPSGPQGEVVRGAARGAAVGAVGGAIGGNAGKGAAIGAGVGATAGLLGRGRQQRQTEQAQEQAVANYNAQVANYNRAFGACMSGRGYTIN
jgi:hypothetical protein